MGVHWTVEVFSIFLTALGAYVAFGPYHDDRTWNLIRNSAKIETIPVPSQEPSEPVILPQEPTHFSLYALAERSTSKPSLLFVPGHAGSWRQGINLCAYLEGAWNFYVTDFHASASALHWSVLSDQAKFTAAAINRLQKHGGSRLTLLGHSMGGRVALEALKTSRQHVNALILISTPVGPHPLLLDPRFAPEAYDLQGLDVPFCLMATWCSSDSASCFLPARQPEGCFTARAPSVTALACHCGPGRAVCLVGII
eukprot:s2526_g13.t1